MRILFIDEEKILNSVEATHISYDKEDSTLWFYTDNEIYQAKYSRIYAESRIKEAYETGKVNLSEDMHAIFTIWKGEENGL